MHTTIPSSAPPQTIRPYQTSLPLLTAEQAAPGAASILAQTQAQLGFVPNMYGAMAQVPGLLETYVDGYQRFRTSGGFTPVEQEVIFLVISRFNGCHYCVAAHSVVADLMSKVPVEVTNAIREGSPVPDQRLAALEAFTRHMLESRGTPSRDAAERFFAAGYQERQILALVLAIAVKTISNYTNHLFQTPVDAMFAPRAWAPESARPTIRP
ncbi:MAG: carboxymuconolactone decarboxylase family protein [Vicinamibacterales bacterium]